MLSLCLYEPIILISGGHLLSSFAGFVIPMIQHVSNSGMLSVFLVIAKDVLMYNGNDGLLVAVHLMQNFCLQPSADSLTSVEAKFSLA